GAGDRGVDGGYAASGCGTCRGGCRTREKARRRPEGGQLAEGVERFAGTRNKVTGTGRTATEGTRRTTEATMSDGLTPKPGTFVKGDPRINREKGPRQKRKIWRALADMRAVYGQDKCKDRGPGQRSMRKFLDKDPNGFVRRLMDAE